MDSAKDDGFKWFGQGFDGFPRRLPEDCVEYSIHIVDAVLAELTIREKLRKIQDAGAILTKKLLKDFIWQGNGFNLEIVREDGYNILHGRTNFGDSIEDEWLIVYLLRELSKQFPEAWVRVFDTDGEFLLIEAANALPRWLNPEVADNRVWLNRGHLLIIPAMPATGADRQGASNTGPLTIHEARAAIQGGQPKLLNARLVEEEAFYRLRNYPQQIQDSLHHSRVAVPRKVAHILHQNPSYISQVIEAFYLRDPIALRPLQEPNPEGLHFPPEDFVIISLKFNKVGFAQLKSQQFSVPASWRKALPSGIDAKAKAEVEMGMKIGCGLEMLVSDPQNQDKRSVRKVRLLLDDLESGDDALPTDEEIALWANTEDDESWLDIDFNDFENELGGKRGGTQRSGATGGFGDKSAQENLQKMVSRFEDFLNQDGMDEMDEDDDSESSSEATEDIGEDKDANFDEDEFTAMMREMMGMPAETMQEIMGPHANKAKGMMNTKSHADTENTKQDSSPDQEPQEPGIACRSESDGENEGDDEEEIRQLSAAMEAELKRAGALSLEDANLPRRSIAAKGSASRSSKHDVSGAGSNPTKRTGKGLGKASARDSEDDTNSDGDGELLDADFNLVANMLESFKGQGGLAGPGGNMLGMMGMQLPRDDGERREEK